MTNINTITSREKWLDSLRGFGILLVVLGHCWPPFRKEIYGFHIPLFFMVSGYLFYHYEYLSFTELLKRLFHRLICPYLVLCAIGLLLDTIMRIIAKMPFALPSFLRGVLLLSWGDDPYMALSCPLWYVTCLFFTLIYYWIVKHHCGKRAALVCFLCTFISYGLSYFGVHKLPWNVDTAFMAIFFVMIGDYMHAERVAFVKKSRIICPIIFICIGGLGIKFNKIDWVNFMWNDYGNYLLMMIGSVPIVIALYIIFKYINFNNKIGDILSKIGQHTLFILGFEYTTGRIARLLLPSVAENWFTVYFSKLLLLFIGFVVWTWIIQALPSERIKHHLMKY